MTSAGKRKPRNARASVMNNALGSGIAGERRSYPLRPPRWAMDPSWLLRGKMTPEEAEALLTFPPAGQRPQLGETSQVQDCSPLRARETPFFRPIGAVHRLLARPGGAAQKEGAARCRATQPKGKKLFGHHEPERASGQPMAESWHACVSPTGGGGPQPVSHRPSGCRLDRAFDPGDCRDAVHRSSLRAPSGALLFLGEQITAMVIYCDHGSEEVDNG